MIIYKNTNEFKELVNKEKELNNQTLEYQTNLKNLLMSYIVKFVDYLDDIKIESTDDMAHFIEQLKYSIELSNNNLDSINIIIKASSKLDNIKVKHNDSTYKRIVNNYNTLLYTETLKINENNNKILDIIFLVSQNSSYNLLTESQAFLNNIDKRSEPLERPEVVEAPPSPTVIDKNFYAYSGSEITLNEIEQEEEIKKDGTEENTLLISESMQKVILPYSIEDLQKYVERYPEHFGNQQDVIDKVYTIPLKAYNNPAIARFRETFRLMREKEHASIKDAIDLGLELMFNYNLYPAIITACKNLDELDIYLAYLDTGEIEKFKIFNIVFQLSPKVSNKKTSS